MKKSLFIEVHHSLEVLFNACVEDNELLDEIQTKKIIDLVYEASTVKKEDSND